MDTRLATGDLQSQLAESRARTEALASAQEEAEDRARSLLEPEKEPSPEDDGTIGWSTVIENSRAPNEVGAAGLGLTEKTEGHSLDLENGITILSHSGLVVLGSSSDIWDRRRRGIRTWRSSDAVELLNGLWRGVMGCFRGMFSVLGMRMGTREERMPLVGV